MANLALVFDILAKDNASKSFRDVGNSAERAGKQGNVAGNAIASGMKLAGGALLGAGIIQGFKSLYEAAAESERIGRLTTQVIKTTGGAAGVSAKQVGDLATAISNKTGVDDEAIQSGQNLLLTFTNIKNAAGAGNDIFSQTTQIMTDMSVALGKDASSSAVMLGKALNDPIKGITALSRAGVSFTAQQKEQIKTLVEAGDTLGAQKIILAELGKEFGGAAEAASTPLDKLKVRAGNLAEQFGSYLVPAVDKAATFTSERLLPAFESTGNFLADVAVPTFKALGTAVGAVADVFNSIPGPVQVGVVALGAIAALKSPVSSALETIGLRALYMKDAVVGAGAGIGGLKAAGSGLVGFFGGPWGLAIAGATAGLTLLSSWLSNSDESASDAAASQGSLASALRQTKGAIDDTVRSAAAADLEDTGLLKWADEWGVASSDLVDAALGVDGALAKVRAGALAYAEAQRAAGSADEERGEVLAGTISAGAGAALASEAQYAALLQLLGVTESTIASQDRQATATAGAATSMQTFAQKTEESQAALNDAKQATDAFKLSLDILTGANVDTTQLTVAFYDAVRQADGALKGAAGSAVDAAGGLDTQSEAGSRAADVLFGVRDRANDLIATMIQQGATTDDVVARDGELRESFITTAEQMGFNRKQAENLANQYYGLPDERRTEITADTGQATTAVNTLQKLIDGLRGRVVNITARAIGPDLNGAASGSGRMGTYYDGGYTGDGGKFEPKGIVHGGEFVFTKEETAKAGASRLAALARSLRGYAAGGLVAPASIRAELDARAYETQMNAFAGQVLKKYEPVQGMIGALQWAKSQVGKPYIWGGVGPAGYDCSGFMSAITNVIRGRSPYSRVGSTASFPWGGFSGGSGPFMIGSTSNAGGGIGHMAGTLLGVNVESTGGVGVKVGGSARGASNGLFSTRAALKFHEGGIVPNLGIPDIPAIVAPGETIRTAQQEAALGRPLDVRVFIGDRELTDIVRVEAEGVVVGALTSTTDRGRYNG